MAIQHFAPKVDKNCWELRHPPPQAADFAEYLTSIPPPPTQAQGCIHPNLSKPTNKFKQPLKNAGKIKE